ncbi:putative alternative oxidase [Lyophyllum shimeji]|uniref:Alternative oxidase n=1 Tax=Lyophyllum shimeji TaxID=47721 RepID=A0A9P3UP03_LYOSH|nr:putative alternative oxidase [Lyophyllum shimeji]
MLKSVIASAAPLQRNSLLYSRTVVLAYPLWRRSFMTSGIRRDALTDKPAQTTSVGPHRHDQPGAASQASQLTRADAVSTVPTMVRGDWVLFHPVYTPDELRAVEVRHREAKTLGDKAAFGMVKFARWIFDRVSGYKHVDIPPNDAMTVQERRAAGHLLDDHGWLNRILFLESIAGVPGMVAATLRHLTSLRAMRRDSGWIHTCLEEAENERMHLMTFMTLKEPSLFFRAIILGAQGVFYNLFFLSYMISPRTCHRFVGYLEEEAVLTYTRCIEDLEAGRIPEWTDKPAPEIAIDYWRLPPDAKLLDVIYAVRSDETTHRFVNHSLANLKPSTDVNPFALREPDMHVKGKKIDFDRSEAEQYVRESHEMIEKQKRAERESA